MRIGYIGHFGDYHTEWGVADALSKRATVDKYCYAKLDKDKFTSRNYDIVLTTLPHALPIDFWQAQKGLKVAHYFDLIVGWRDRDKAYFPVLKHFDLVLSTDGSNNRAYTNAGIRRRWLLQAVNPKWYYPLGEMEPQREVGFIGGGYGARPKMFRELRRHFDFEAFGQNGQYRGESHSKICATSKIMVATNAVNNIPGYWSNRVYLHLACGAFVLHPNVPGMEKYFKDGEHLVYYNHSGELVEKIKYWLKHEDERKEIARQGCELVHKSHTWDSRMGTFWRQVNALTAAKK